HERVQSVKERYKNLQLLVRYQTNEPTTMMMHQQNRRLSQEVSDLPRLREDNEFLAGVNAEFSSENDDLKEEVNELKMKLEQYQIRLSSESLDVIDVPEERLAKWFKSDGSKKGKKTIEMKMILKTIKPNNNLDNNETFNSPKNVEIHSRLIPELQRAMFLNYKPSVAQLTN
ncbi:3571_t:CDS:2, partial [Rhizophagus irregularis]